MSAPSAIALVTGAYEGIGLEVVRQLAARGARVYLTARDREAGERAVDGIKGDVHFLPLDVTRSREHRKRGANARPADGPSRCAGQQCGHPARRRRFGSRSRGRDRA